MQRNNTEINCYIYMHMGTLLNWIEFVLESLNSKFVPQADAIRFQVCGTNRVFRYKYSLKWTRKTLAMLSKGNLLTNYHYLREFYGFHKFHCKHYIFKFQEQLCLAKPEIGLRNHLANKITVIAKLCCVWAKIQKRTNKFLMEHDYKLTFAIDTKQYFN